MDYGEPWEDAEQAPAILTRHGLRIVVEEDDFPAQPAHVLCELRDRILAEHAACAGAADPQPGELARLRNEASAGNLKLATVEAHMLGLAEATRAIDERRLAAIARFERAEAQVADLTAQRDAYARAKAENDERFMAERDEARAQRDAQVAALERVRYAMRSGCASPRSVTKTLRMVEDALCVAGRL